MKQRIVLLLGIFLTINLWAQVPSITEKTEGLTITEGFFDYYFDENHSTLWLVVDKLNSEFLYANYLAAGVGSNDIGLDRSQQGGERIVFFEKRGAKLFLIQPNVEYIARSDNELEKKSVREAFASSVLAAFEIAATSDEQYLIDLTPYLIRDAHDVIGRLRRRGEGNYSLDKNRSTLYKEGTFNFPNQFSFSSI